MKEGILAQWLKKVGDKISEGDILAEIETDKATMEFESFQSGTLLEIGLKEGKDYAFSKKFNFMETSAKNNVNIDIAFQIFTNFTWCLYTAYCM